jgi:hypothetical protein
LRPRQREQAIRAVIPGAQRGKFSCHGGQFRMVANPKRRRSLEHDRIRCGEAGQGVDMRVGIVAFQIAVVQPQEHGPAAASPAGGP